MISPVIVVLAAGESRRFGGIKQLADIAGVPMLRRLLLVLLTYQAPLVVVTGSHAEKVEASLETLSIHIVRHASWQDGMGRSLAAGVQFAGTHFPRASGVLVCLADQPLIDPSLYQDLLARHAQAPDRILVTEHDHVVGPPVLFPRDLFDALTRCTGARGARTLIEAESARVEVFVATHGIDVDTPQDLQNVLERLARSDKNGPSQ